MGLLHGKEGLKTLGAHANELNLSDHPKLLKCMRSLKSTRLSKLNFYYVPHLLVFHWSILTLKRNRIPLTVLSREPNYKKSISILPTRRYVKVKSKGLKQKYAEKHKNTLISTLYERKIYLGIFGPILGFFNLSLGIS